MKKPFTQSLVMLIWMTVLTGLLYPLFITMIAQLTMKGKADGDFVYTDERIVGARLIGQPFTEMHYFWPRPSAVEYHTLPAGASNLGPTSAQLSLAVKQRREKWRQLVPKGNMSDIPDELLYTSASGVDPHITVEAARFQIPRIVTARRWDPSEGEKRLTELIRSMTEEYEYVNVLLLNVALSEQYPQG